MIAGARTGSTLLQKTLATHPEVSCHGEVFNMKVPSIKDSPLDNSSLGDYLLDWRNRSTEKFLEELVYYPGNFKAIGLKILYQQFERAEWKNVLLKWYQRHPEISVIHLVRKNLFRRYLSQAIACRTQIWDIQSGTPKPRSEAIEIEYETCIGDIQAMKAKEAHYSAVFKRHRCLNLCYEDLHETPQLVWTQIENFLEIELCPLHAQTERLSTDELSSMVSNLDDLRNRSQGTEYHHYFF